MTVFTVSLVYSCVPGGWERELMVGKGWGWNAKFTTELIQQQMHLGLHAYVPTITYALFRG